MAERFIKIAVLYLSVGVCLGLYMGISQNFTLVTVHVHVLLAGWLSLAMAGVIYRLYPDASTTRLAQAHFWLHNLGLPAFMLGLGMMLTGHDLPVLLPAGATVAMLGFLCFALNAWRRIKA